MSEFQKFRDIDAAVLTTESKRAVLEKQGVTGYQDPDEYHYVDVSFGAQNNENGRTERFAIPPIVELTEVDNPKAELKEQTGIKMRYRLTSGGALLFDHAVKFTCNPTNDTYGAETIDDLGQAEVKDSTVGPRVIAGPNVVVANSSLGLGTILEKDVEITASQIETGLYDKQLVSTTIGEGTKVDASKVRGSTIGKENKILKGSKVLNIRTDSYVQVSDSNVGLNDLPPTVIGQYSTIHNSFVDANVNIANEVKIQNRSRVKGGTRVYHGAELDHATVESNATVEINSKVHKSTLGRGTHIGCRAVIACAKLGNHNTIGDGSKIEGKDDENPVVTDVRVSLGRMAVLKGSCIIGAGVKIGDNSSLTDTNVHRGAEIGAWNNFIRSAFGADTRVGPRASGTSGIPVTVVVGERTLLGDNLKWYQSDITVGSDVIIGKKSEIRVHRIANDVVVAPGAVVDDEDIPPRTIVIPKDYAYFGKRTVLAPKS